MRLRAAALLLALALPAAGRAADDAATVATLEDRQAIEELFHAYGRAVDAQDFNALAGLFARNGQWTGAGGSGPTGPTAIRAFMEKTFGVGALGKWQGDFHLVRPLRIDVAGDRATAKVRWIFASPQVGSAQMIYAGHYHDMLVREDGRWRFARRVVTADISPGPAAR